VEERVLAAEEIQKHLADGPAKKVIVVPGKIVNVVV
jgi:leucyl-tRNA synthetase